MANQLLEVHTDHNEHGVPWQSGMFHAGRIQVSLVSANSLVFHDVKVLLGQKGVNQTEKPLRLVGYLIEDKQYWVATDRFDLTAEQIALVYKLRWDIEKFFAWWKRHLKVYHLIAKSQHGLMIQILAGLSLISCWLSIAMNNMVNRSTFIECVNYETKSSMKAG